MFEFSSRMRGLALIKAKTNISHQESNFYATQRRENQRSQAENCFRMLANKILTKPCWPNF